VNSRQPRPNLSRIPSCPRATAALVFLLLMEQRHERIDPACSPGWGETGQQSDAREESFNLSIRHGWTRSFLWATERVTEADLKRQHLARDITRRNPPQSLDSKNHSRRIGGTAINSAGLLRYLRRADIRDADLSGAQSRNEGVSRI